MYLGGEGVEKDVNEALRWYRKAAENGVYDAQLRLGDFYFDGKVVERDIKVAQKWYLQAAKQEDADAGDLAKNMWEACELLLEKQQFEKQQLMKKSNRRRSR